MHPINKRHFGVGKLLVKFHDGTALVDGYIVKQVGTSRYVVKAGTVTKTITLAQTTALAQMLTGEQALDATHTVDMIANLGTMVLTVGAGKAYVKKLARKIAFTTENAALLWTQGTPSASVYGISKF